MKYATKVWLEQLIRHPSVDGKIALKWTLETKTMKEWTDLNYHSTVSINTLLSKIWQTIMIPTSFVTL